jgi:DNA-binding MarR family transcriptional regulator
VSERENRMNKLLIMQRLGVAFLTWRRYLQSHLVPYHITLKQVFVLRQLAKGEFLLPSQIAEMLFCDRPTATVIIKNMEKQGWLAQEQDVQDRRQIRVIITEKGRAKLAEIELPWAQIESSFDPLACFNEQEAAALDQLLVKLNNHLKQIKQS